MFRSAIFLALFLPWTLLILVTGIPLSFIHPGLLNAYARLWARVSLALAGIRVTLEGTQHLRPGAPAVYMPNHQSNLDILALQACLPGQFRWLAKKELFRIPLFGYAMRRADAIAIDRGDRERAIASMHQAARRIASGTPVMIFPEGTRSPDGRLLPFKKGGFVTAIEAQVPVVPMVIAGSHAALPKHSLRLRPGTVRVTILEPLATAGLTFNDRDRLMNQVRQAIADTLERCDD